MKFLLLNGNGGVRCGLCGGVQGGKAAPTAVQFVDGMIIAYM